MIQESFGCFQNLNPEFSRISNGNFHRQYYEISIPLLRNDAYAIKKQQQQQKYIYNQLAAVLKNINKIVYLPYLLVTTTYRKFSGINTTAHSESISVASKSYKHLFQDKNRKKINLKRKINFLCTEKKKKSIKK